MLEQIHVTMNRLDAEILLPLIKTQSEGRFVGAGGPYWLGLHVAISAGLHSAATPSP
jgi:hypothetical protein